MPDPRKEDILLAYAEEKEENAKLRAEVEALHKEKEMAISTWTASVEKERDAALLQVDGLTKLLRRAEDVLGPDRTATERKATLMEIGKHFAHKPKCDCTCHVPAPTARCGCCAEKSKGAYDPSCYKCVRFQESCGDHIEKRNHVHNQVRADGAPDRTICGICGIWLS